MTDKPVEERKKTYKREFSILVFFGCLAWSVYSGDTKFLEITFMPTLLIAGAALGMHEYTNNMLKR